MRTNKLLFYILSLFFTALSWSQNTAEDYDYPMTPNAAALTQFGNVPVGLYSGSSQFNVPIYTVQGINLSVPITLNYNSGNGLKIEDLSSWVGAGWTLDAGGLISRSIKSIPDEINNDSPPNIDSNCIIPSELQKIEESNHDVEYDRFSYNFMGQSGSFIIVDGEVKQLEENGNKIQVIGNLFTEFIITDSNGIKYYFGKAYGNGCTPIEFTYKETGSFNVATAWYLTKIKHWSGEEMILDYECDGLSVPYQINFNQTKTKNISAGSDGCSECPLPSISWSPLSAVNYSTWRTSNVYLSKIYCPNLFDYANFDRNGTKLKSIRAATKVIEFSISTPNSSINKFRFYLDKVTFKSYGTPAVNGEIYQFEYYNKSDVQPISSFKRDSYGYYNSNIFASYLGNRSADPTKAQVGALSKIIYPTGGYSIINYEGNSKIDVGSCSGTTQLPNADGTFSWSYGIPGAIKLGETTNFIIPGASSVSVTFKLYEGYTQIVPINGQTVGYAYFTIASNDGYSYSFPQPASSTTYDVPRTFTLTLQPGEYYIGVSVRGAYYKAAYRFALCNQFSSPTYTQYGGIRVKSILNYAFNGTLATSKTYTYNNPDRAIPKSTIYTYDVPQDCLVGLGNVGGYCMQEVQTNLTPMSRTGVNDFFYSNVTENFIDENMTKYFISHSFSLPRYSAVPSPTLSCDAPDDSGQEYFGSPYEKSTSYYKSTPTKNLLVKKEIYEYPENMEILETFNSYSRNYRTMMGPLIYSTTLPPGVSCITDVSGLNLKMQLGLYRYARTWFPLKSKIVTEYSYNDAGFLSGNTNTTENYFYDNPIHRQLTRKENFTSEYFSTNIDTGPIMKKITTKYTYPDDIITANSIYGSPLATNAFNAVNLAMKSNYLHITGQPIQIEKIDNDGNHLETTRSNFKLMANSNNVSFPLLETTEKLKGNFDPSTNPFLGNKSFSQYNFINMKPQMIQDSETNKVTSILYGYNHRYPVLIVKNSYFNGVMLDFFINSSGLHGYGNEIEDLVNLLSSYGYLPEGFMYKKLVGVSKKILPNSLSTTYVYDALNRLVQIKDNHGNIISQYEYHYAN